MFETSDGRFAFEIADEHTYCECGVDECDHWEEQYLNVLVAEKVGASLPSHQGVYPPMIWPRN